MRIGPEIFDAAVQQVREHAYDLLQRAVWDSTNHMNNADQTAIFAEIPATNVIIDLFQLRVANLRSAETRNDNRRPREDHEQHEGRNLLEPPVVRARQEGPVRQTNVQNFPFDCDVDDEDPWRALEVQDENEAGIGGDNNENIGRRATVVLRNTQSGTKRTLQGMLFVDRLETMDGKTFHLPPPVGWAILSTTEGVDVDDDEVQQDQWQVDQEDDDNLHTIGAVINFKEKHGIWPLEQALLKEYLSGGGGKNDFGLKRDIDRLVMWTKHHTREAAEKPGRMMLIDLQCTAAARQGVNPVVMRANLMKSETGVTPYSVAMAKLARGGRGGDRGGPRNRGGDRGGYGGGHDFRSGGGNPSAASRQCSHCGKQYHTSSYCRAKNQPKNGQIPKIPGCIPS